MGRKLLGNIITVVDGEAQWGDGFEKEERRRCMDGNSWSLIKRDQ